MKEQVKEYVKQELDKLLNGEVKEINLSGVYPQALYEILGDFEISEMETNGWQVDYWITTEKYEIEGSMFYGNAKITLV
ncbi:hypothetical protein DA469_21665 [Bacillus subtilis]|nr:hypothetical protein DA469_21665 [Bacillus subtilis]